MTRKLTEYEDMSSTHMNELGNRGREFVTTAKNIITLLESEFLGKEQLSHDQKHQFFRTLIDASGRYFSLLDEITKQQKAYLASMQESSEDIQT